MSCARKPPRDPGPLPQGKATMVGMTWEVATADRQGDDMAGMEELATEGLTPWENGVAKTRA
jgi:hypothetical protein